jgi:ubiquinone/menaquinone biosynthesis C-methylase UbiE
MSEPATQVQIDAARAYEALFVSALFAPWAPRVADVAQIRAGQRVLDVACGTGVLAREVATRTGRSGSVTGLDPGPGMLAVARDLAPDIDWRVGVAESLPFADRLFDVVVSQFGLMFFTDRRQALREMLRVVIPGGHMAVAVWDSLERNPAYQATVALLERRAGPRAADVLRAPFALGDKQNLLELFTDAGVSSLAIDNQDGTARFPDVRTMVEADLRGWLPMMGVGLLHSYVTAEGPMVFTTRAHLITGRRP